MFSQYTQLLLELGIPVNSQNNCKWSDWELHFSVVPSVMEKPSTSDYDIFIQEFLKIWRIKIRSVQLKIQQHFRLKKMLFCFFLLTINLFVQSTCEMTFTFGRFPNVQLHLHRAVAEEQKVMWLMLIKLEVKSVSSCANPAQLNSPVQSYNYHSTITQVLCCVEQRAGQRLPGCLLQKQENGPSATGWTFSQLPEACWNLFSYSTFRLSELKHVLPPPPIKRVHTEAVHTLATGLCCTWQIASKRPKPWNQN